MSQRSNFGERFNKSQSKFYIQDIVKNMTNTSKPMNGLSSTKDHLDVIVEAVYGKRDVRKIRRINVNDKNALTKQNSPLDRSFDGDIFEVAHKRKINNVSSIYVSSSDEEGQNQEYIKDNIENNDDIIEIT